LTSNNFLFSSQSDRTKSSNLWVMLNRIER
jgi:hypothetical protein